MYCQVCGWHVKTPTFVRPLTGGRRETLFLCEGSCTQDTLAGLLQVGWEETRVVLGYDVFIPIWSVIKPAGDSN